MAFGFKWQKLFNSIGLRCCQGFLFGDMTWSNGNIFRVAGSLCGEFSRHRWMSLIKASHVERHASDLRRHLTHCDVAHRWVISSPLSIALQVLLQENITRISFCLSSELFFKTLLLQVAFLIFFSIAILSPHFLQVGLLLQYVALFQSGNYFRLI